ncbi:MAG: zinc-ribbon domain-containing protein [Treponema sp.]|uniref:zinc ribbon domain-containing protein n=1 Tax=Treponema sp. TaxID=166 RepID=UPI0025EE58AA|nr:zinc ribbon domain-containing protein [Treponema sp.]MBQ8681207.1 zinc-ribbon domain-containing protein [Treponema sp.]MBR1403109.1 zinc-ribbon domain-containing protein [Treponema sp.]
MFCKNCGKEIEEGAKFCPNCGTATAVTVEAKPAEKIGDSAEVSEKSDSEQIQTGGQFKMKLWMFLIAAVAGVCFGIGEGINLIGDLALGEAFAMFIFAGICVWFILILKKDVVIDFDSKTLKAPLLWTDYNDEEKLFTAIKDFFRITTVNLSQVTAIDFHHSKEIVSEQKVAYGGGHETKIVDKNHYKLYLKTSYGTIRTFSYGKGKIAKLYDVLVQVCKNNPNFKAYESSETNVNL